MSSKNCITKYMLSFLKKKKKKKIYGMYNRPRCFTPNPMVLQRVGWEKDKDREIFFPFTLYNFIWFDFF